MEIKEIVLVVILVLLITVPVIIEVTKENKILKAAQEKFCHSKGYNDVLTVRAISEYENKNYYITCYNNTKYYTELNDYIYRKAN